jgi:hypothetical protein
MPNFTNSGWGRGAWGQGRWNGAGIMSSLTGIKVEQSRLKKLKQQQYRLQDDEEVSALILLKQMQRRG